MRSRAFLLGVGTAYFFDPRLGRRRRNMARDRGAKAARSLRRATRRRVRFTAGKAHGWYARGRFIIARPEMKTDDAMIEQRIRSETFRHAGVSAGCIEVGVDDGLVTLTGEVAGEKLATDLVARVLKMPGVEDVAAMLHVVADEPAGESLL
jgi:osmotically-inducible protein OsmY